MLFKPLDHVPERPLRLLAMWDAKAEEAIELGPKNHCPRARTQWLHQLIWSLGRREYFNLPAVVLEDSIQIESSSFDASDLLAHP